jgi:hypothetical protein
VPSDRPVKKAAVSAPEPAEEGAAPHASGTFRMALRAPEVTLSSREISVIGDAIRIVKRELSHLPEADQREELHTRLEECVGEVCGWTAPPTGEQRTRVMHRILRLQIEVTRLARGGV